jgi:hypothetical protein
LSSNKELNDVSPKRQQLIGPTSMIDRSTLRRSISSGGPENSTEDEPHQENLNARWRKSNYRLQNNLLFFLIYNFFRALEVINRIQAKLSGRDFIKNDDSEDLNVEQQVDRLIKEASSIENLCQLFVGWCPLW